MRHGIILFRRLPEPFHRLVIILRDALAVLKRDTEIALRLRVALIGGLPHFLKRLPCAAVLPL